MARILEWVALSYSKESSQFNDRTHESPVLTGRFFTTKTTWEPISPILALIPLGLNINECLSIPLPLTTHLLSTHYVLDIVLGTEKYRTKYGPYLFK